MIHYMTTQGVGDAWVGNELNVMRKAGVPFVLHALRKSSRKLFDSPWANELLKNTRFIYPIPKLEFIVSALMAPFLFGPRFWGALFNALFGERESFRNRVVALGHLFVAAHWARGLRNEKVSHIHSQWIHSGGTVAYYGAWLLGVSFSFTGHAADLFRQRVALKDKIKRAEFIVCISEFHRDFFIKQGADPNKLIIGYCGINLDLYKPKPEGSTRNLKLQIRSSGRLVDKKGFNHLIAACAILRDRNVDFQCVIGGNGPLFEPLSKQIAELKLEDYVKLTNQEITQEAIPQFMYEGDVYCLPCVWAKDNDVDGLPQMLMEAMACGLPAISTRLVGIPDLIIHEKTGLLCEPGDEKALADALERLWNNPELSQSIVVNAMKILREKFDLNHSLSLLIEQYRKRLDNSAA
jgi:colanic acid/amylovoran biosynthesis glycosyltransferase